MRTVFWVGFWTFLADQASKYLVVHSLNLRELGELIAVPGFLNLRMAWNYGVNFGLFAEDSDLTRWVLVAVALVISGAVLWWTHHEENSWQARVSAGLLVGGAMGNVIDRLLYGAVADFLNVTCCGFNNPYSFNIADIAVFAGAVGMVVFTGSNTGSKTGAKKPS
ncbi:signal peptidase II [Alisedimentitalea sp. MJ-SS2]|uniref:signal peptidase II n=1 Tax=Aliisedimentitalea sp. MJ-SS2 TaxID=3049795 RepID=UPI00291113DE|nr:signal peptidase II [Alisedimentitalea sp. MJ-SS2]MDU8928025.1 signal peptidase II [Alisedimentitalea sp. MJ-SS2]